MKLKVFGNIFSNRKKTASRQPDYRGTFRVDKAFADELARKAQFQTEGVELVFAGWTKQDRNGNDYISGNVEISDNIPQRSGSDQNDPKPQQSSGSWEDEIPF